MVGGGGVEIMSMANRGMNQTELDEWKAQLRRLAPELAKRLELKEKLGIVGRIHEYATDLAIGYDEDYWSSELALNFTNEYKTTRNPDDYDIFIRSKWEGNLPSIQSVVSMGYLRKVQGDTYTLTDKGIRLADAPAIPPNVFISYKRSESSAFALLLEARITYETNATPFLDQSIEPGDDWHPRLEEKVEACEAFVCVIGPSTLDSPYVRNEIRWAQNSEKNSLILPVWHNGYDGSPESNVLKDKQAVIVESENAKNYDSAVNEVLNRLGYSPHFIAQRR